MLEVKQIDYAIQEQQQRSNNIETESSKLKIYLNFFAIEDLKLLQNFKNIFIQSLPSSIEYDFQSGFAKKMVIKIINNSKNYQFIDIQAKLGYFRFKKISIINIKGESGTHQIENKASGNFCTVYRCFCKQLNLAFKCFAKYPNCQTGDLRLKYLIQEFCIAKLASCLEVGPKIYDNLGYDIMVYENCMQFCMQRCLLFPQQKMGMFESDLKANLLKLHSIKIAHHDIKIENICYSNQFKKFVFIDFGISTIIEEDIGKKSFTFFRGSLNYCSLEMADNNNNNITPFQGLWFEILLMILRGNLRDQKVKLEHVFRFFSFSSKCPSRRQSLRSPSKMIIMMSQNVCCCQNDKM